jgi:DNA-binding transcriptional regulator LsrR (DeoR family)
MDTERRDFLIEVARLYYQQELSQAEIARRFGISRSAVSLLLKTCRQQKIVEIRIQDPISGLLRLQTELRERFRLQEALVAPAERSSEEAKARVGQAGASLLERLLADGMRIGVSWGTTLFQLVRHARAMTRKDVEVIQLHGGLGAEDPAIDAFGLAQSLAEKLRGRYRIIQAPISVASRELRDMLVREPDIAETLRRGAQARIALFGIGSNRPEASSLVRTGYLSAEQSGALLKAGAVGTVCGLHIDWQGLLFPCPWNERVVGIDAPALLGIPLRIGIAAGEEKADAVRAALQGGFITTLVTEENLALKLIQ